MAYRIQIEVGDSTPAEYRTISGEYPSPQAAARELATWHEDPGAWNCTKRIIDDETGEVYNPVDYYQGWEVR